MQKHIAIVEDQPAIRENYIDAFTRHGYRVSGYSNRSQALTAFTHTLPDLIIIDINLGTEVEGVGVPFWRIGATASRNLQTTPLFRVPIINICKYRPPR